MLDTKRTRHKYYPLISMLIFQKDIDYQSQNYFYVYCECVRVCVCVNVCAVYNETYITSSIVRRSRSNDTRVPKGTPNTQILVSKYHSPIKKKKKNWLLEEMVDMGKVPKNPEILCTVRK